MLLPHRNKGFTLVEVLASMGLIALVVGMAATLMLAAMNSYARGARIDQAKQLGLAVYGCYEGHLQGAAAVQIGGEAPAGASALTLRDGQLLLDGEALYGEAVTGGLEARVTCQRDEAGTALSLTVEILSDGRALFVKSSAFSLTTLARKGGSASGPLGPAVNPAVYYK